MYALQDMGLLATNGTDKSVPYKEIHQSNVGDAFMHTKKTMKKAETHSSGTDKSVPYKEIHQFNVGDAFMHPEKQ